MRKACWKRLGVATVAVSALVLCPSASKAGDGLVAMQTGDASCPDDSGNVYVDCGNGTVTDNRSGLVWLKNAACLAQVGGTEPLEVDWYTAVGFVAGLSDFPGEDPDDCGLSDRSSPGEWRLPSKAEWQAMIANALGGPFLPDCRDTPPTITNDSGFGCWVQGPSSFTGVVDAVYWAATTNRAFPAEVGTVDLLNGTPENSFKDELHYVWPVRGGQ